MITTLSDALGGISPAPKGEAAQYPHCSGCLTHTCTLRSDSDSFEDVSADRATQRLKEGPVADSTASATEMRTMQLEHEFDDILQRDLSVELHLKALQEHIVAATEQRHHLVTPLALSIQACQAETAADSGYTSDRVLELRGDFQRLHWQLKLLAVEAKLGPIPRGLLYEQRALTWSGKRKQP